LAGLFAATEVVRAPAAEGAAYDACRGRHARGGLLVPVRRWFSRGGTTPDELARVMPGDALIANPTKTDTQAVTVNAPPGDIWPWLVRVGYQRGGLYSHDWLDRLFGFLDRPSATCVLDEFQQLAVGDKIRLGPPRGTHRLSSGPASRTRSQLSGARHGVGVAVRPLSTRQPTHTSGFTRHRARPKYSSLWLGMRIMEPAALS
jgi:hypothetical protein